MIEGHEAVIREVYARIRKSKNPVFIKMVDEDEAVAQAVKAAGPLAGLPFAVKDNIDVAGLPTTAACPSFSYVPERSAAAVQRLVDAGAVVVGKTNLDQFATGLVGTRSPYGACHNAFNESYISGGSSSGSAVAVALGMANFALGTDTAGSGRVPAAFNNVVGLKPTPGSISTEGVVPACRSLDCVSLFTRTSDEAFAVFEVLRQTRESTWFRDDKPRIAVPEHLEFFGDQGYAALFSKAVARLRAWATDCVQIDFQPFLEVQKLLYGPWVAERLADLEPYLSSMLSVTRKIIESGKQYSAVELFRAQHKLLELKKQCRGAWDVLVVPGAPTIYRISEVNADPIETNSRLGLYTNFVNLLGLAAITVPAGFREDGIPFGITLIGPPNSEASLARLGARFTGTKLPPEGRPALSLAVVGAHMSGMALNHELVERKAVFLRKASTARKYRLFSLGSKPGLVKTDSGYSIELEIWQMTREHFGDFVARIPAPLGVGTIELEDGESVQGFLCEASAAKGAVDISDFGGWRAYLRSKR